VRCASEPVGDHVIRRSSNRNILSKSNRGTYAGRGAALTPLIAKPFGGMPRQNHRQLSS
jgi:hypothetical protein